MKKLNYLAILVSMALVFTACPGTDPEPPNGGPTSITLTPATAAIEVGATVTLTAELYPPGSEGTIVWTSSNNAIATVANGVVTGVAEGIATITAAVGTVTANALVNVTYDPLIVFEDVLGLGREFFPIYLDEISRAEIDSRVVMDLGPNDMYKWLWIWPDGNSYVGGVIPGFLNFFGHSTGWMALEVGTLGWSGKGYFIGNDVDPDWHASALSHLNAKGRMMDNPEEWYFHVAMRLGNATDSHLFIIYGATGTFGRLAVGNAPYVDGGNTFQLHPHSRVLADGEWHQVLVPMTYFFNHEHPAAPNNNLFLPSNNTEGRNIVATLSGGVTGTELQYDALMFVRAPIGGWPGRQ